MNLPHLLRQTTSSCLHWLKHEVTLIPPMKVKTQWFKNVLTGLTIIVNRKWDDFLLKYLWNQFLAQLYLTSISWVILYDSQFEKYKQCTWIYVFTEKYINQNYKIGNVWIEKYSQCVLGFFFFFWSWKGVILKKCLSYQYFCQLNKSSQCDAILVYIIYIKCNMR